MPKATIKHSEAISIRDKFFRPDFWGYNLFEILKGDELRDFINEELRKKAHWAHLAGDVESAKQYASHIQ